MSIKIRSVLTTQNTTLDTNKDTAFPDNNNKEITAAILRTWLDELLSQVQDIIDSYFNKLDELRITSTLTYDIVATPSDWNGGTAPATQNLVNDELAGRVKTIENSLPIVKEFQFFFNTSSPTSNEVPSYGTVDIFGTERQDGSITSVEYETSTDKINWTNRGNLGGLDFFMSGATSTTFLWIRAVNPVVTGLGEKGFIVQYN